MSECTVTFSSSELSLCQSSQQDSSTSAAAQKCTIHKLPPPLTSLQRHKYKQLSKEAISTLCEEVFAKGVIAMSADEAMYLEECTRLQAQWLLWFEHRIGRITASKFLHVSQASLTSPPSSLVKLIMEQQRQVKTMRTLLVQWQDSMCCQTVLIWKPVQMEWLHANVAEKD